jgi:hypothetical protein
MLGPPQRRPGDPGLRWRWRGVSLGLGRTQASPMNRPFADGTPSAPAAGLVRDRLAAIPAQDGTEPLMGGHHVLGHAGAELIAATRDQPPPRPSDTARRIRRIATHRTLAHRLGVNQFFTDLAAHARTHPDAALDRWWSEARCAAPGAFAAGLISPIRPDGHGIYREGNRRLGFYLEYDTGGEDHRILLAKLDGYNDHVAKGGPRWPILFWAPHARPRTQPPRPPAPPSGRCDRGHRVPSRRS